MRICFEKSFDELMQIDGIGEKTAQKIMDIIAETVDFEDEDEEDEESDEEESEEKAEETGEESAGGEESEEK